MIPALGAGGRGFDSPLAPFWVYEPSLVDPKASPVGFEPTTPRLEV